MPSNGFQEQLSLRLTLLSRPLQFWVQAVDVYTSYELRTAIVKDGEKREVMWEQQHEVDAEKMYSLLSSMGSFLRVSFSFAFDEQSTLNLEDQTNYLGSNVYLMNSLRNCYWNSWSCSKTCFAIGKIAQSIKNWSSPTNPSSS